MNRKQAIATLEKYELDPYGNTLHIKGKGFNAIAPQANAHSDGNGGWIAFMGSSLASAIEVAVTALTGGPICPECEDTQIEEQGESGEFWWHCHQCGKDFEKEPR